MGDCKHNMWTEDPSSTQSVFFYYSFKITEVNFLFSNISQICVGSRGITQSNWQLLANNEFYQTSKHNG